MNEPMSGETIKGIRREIMKTLGVKIPYEHPIFQMLKRGIGLYIESMPDEYKWILQRLLSNRQIGIVISDKTLCMGIDLPVRTCCLMEFNGNNDFSNEDYLQMSGRAGRRGLDNRGNVIFYGDIDIQSLMKGYLPNIVGNDKNLLTSYKMLSKINSKIDNVDKIFNYFFNDDRNIVDVDISTENDKLSWYLRNYIESGKLIDQLEDIECHLFRNKVDGDLFILAKIYELIGCDSLDKEYKSNKIETGISNKLGLFNEIYEIVIYIYNSVHKDKYLLLRKSLKIIYDNIRNLIIKYNGF